MNKLTTVLAVVFGTALLAAPALAQVTITGSPQQITGGPDNQFSPAIDGNLVVYSSTSAATGDTDVFFTDLGTMLETQVTTAPGAQELQDVSGGTIVYKDTAIFGGSHIYSYDVATGATSPVVAPNGNESAPTVSGSIVVCESRGTNVDVYAYDLQTGVSTPVAITADDERLPRVDGTRVVYERSTASGWDVVVADLAGGSTVLATGLSAEPTPDLSGGTVVYVTTSLAGDLDLAVVDLATGAVSVLAAPGDQTRPRLAGEMLAYDDAAGADLDVVLRHLPSGTSHRIPGTGTFEFLNDLTPGKVAYSSNASGTFDVWVYSFVVSLPAPPSGDLCDGATAPTSSHTFTASAEAQLTGGGSGSLVVRVEGDCDDASLSVDGTTWLDETDLGGGPACWAFAVDFAASTTVAVSLDDDDHGEEADDDHGEEADDDHGEEADDDHGEEAACSITVEVYLGASSVSANASSLPGSVTPTTPSAGCASAGGTPSLWILVLLALGLALAGRRAPIPVRVFPRSRR